MEYDAILYLSPSTVQEAYDPRTLAPGGMVGVDRGLVNPGYINYDDPKMYAGFSFGQILQTRLNDLGKYFSAKVTDFGKWVVAEVTCVNVVTGRSASKTFLIVFNLDNSGMVLNTHNKYRTINGVEQAASYIRSSCSALQSSISNKI